VREGGKEGRKEGRKEGSGGLEREEEEENGEKMKE